jgi:GAF domain-containing protein
MTIDDPSGGVTTLRVVYYGAAFVGKTTNLELISALIHGSESRRLMPRQVGDNRIASLEIPAGSLGRLKGSDVLVRLETMQGEVSSGGGGWPSALSEADGVVFVVDSSPPARTANFKALAGIRERLEGRGRSAGAIPVVMQWNKRDRSDARPIAELETELNHLCFPSIEATSLRGPGVAETLIEILKRTLYAAHRKSGETALSEAELGQQVTATIQRLSQAAREAAMKRFGITIERQPAAWPDVRESPRLRRDIEVVAPRELVYSAGSIGEDTSATRMLAALGRAASSLDDRSVSGLPRGLMAGLLAGSERTHGSLLLFRPGTSRLEESEIVPAGVDPLNVSLSETGATKAASLCSGREPHFIGDLAEAFFRDNFVPGTERLQAALIVPLAFGTQTFGGLIVYVTEGERAPLAAEHAYWRTAATLASVYLSWMAEGDRTTEAPRAGSSGMQIGASPPSRQGPDPQSRSDV